MSKHTVRKTTSLWDPAILRPAVGDAFKKLDPRVMARNPVMFVVEVGCVLVTVIFVQKLATGTPVDVKFNVQLIVWLWFTVLFANFAEAVAEGRGKAQAATLRKMRTTTTALRTLQFGGVVPTLATGVGRARGEVVPATDLRKGDQIYCKAGDLIPADGEIVAGVA